LQHLIAAGARVLESACGPCIGMGQAPSSGGVSLRTFNRNFRGRSGTPDAEIYLCSAETAVASAVAGAITDPCSLGEAITVPWPRRFWSGADLIIPPNRSGSSGHLLFSRCRNFLPFHNRLKAQYS
jgi:aconitate hydratase